MNQLSLRNPVVIPVWVKPPANTSGFPPQRATAVTPTLPPPGACADAVRSVEALLRLAQYANVVRADACPPTTTSDCQLVAVARNDWIVTLAMTTPPGGGVAKPPDNTFLPPGQLAVDC
jgi:hypothetical protein